MTRPPFPSLAALQHLVWRLISAPEGAASGAAALVREGALASDDLGALVEPSEGMTATERVDVYADMYFYRLRDCLAEDFPVLAAWLGDASWHNLVTDYLLAHPPVHFSLRELGRALPGFLTGHALADSCPGAADLARLEWARVDVFDETDAEPLDRDGLLARAADPSAALRLLPAARLLEVDGSTLPRWRRHQEGEAPAGPPAGAGGPVLVWRAGFRVFHRSLAADEARCLEALAAGTGLAALGELLAETLSDDEAAARRLAELIGCWTRDGLLVPGREAPHHPAPGAGGSGS